MSERADLVLLVFGITSLIGIWIVGVLIDHRLRQLTLVSTMLFGISAVMLGIWGEAPTVIYGAVAAWGLAFGGGATLFQTALAKAAGAAADVAQSMLVTVWNMAIAGGGIVGGLLLERVGVRAFPAVLVILLLAALVVAWASRTHGFTPARGPDLKRQASVQETLAQKSTADP